MRTGAFHSNTLETANMALNIIRVLDTVRQKKPLPENYRPILNRGMSFMDEAKGGMATISGSAKQADSFHGTFGPSSLVTDVCLVFKDKNTKNTRDLERRLIKYRELLDNLSEGSSDIDLAIVPEIEHFFETIFDVLTMNEDPTVSSYSQPFSR